MDILDIYRQHSIHFATEGDRHTSRGWVNVHCPFCTGSPGLHLGFNLEKKFWVCWRCGWHNPIEALTTLCQINEREARRLYYDELKAASGAAAPIARERQSPVRLSLYKRPSDVAPLRAPHKRYLAGRDFDPDEIAAEWGVVSTGPVSSLDHIDYRHRILVPIMWDGREVSFQCRDVTGKSDVKYKACPPDREMVHHKHILYGRQDQWTRAGIAVEGVTDVWRLGPHAFALFGIQFKTEQVMVIAKHFDRVGVVFDGGDRAAQKQARKLCAQLDAVGVDAFVTKLGDGVDPGSLSDDDAAHLVRQIV